MGLPSVLDLMQAPSAPSELVGGKAASLARLMGLGLPVPPAVAVTTAAFEQFCAYNNLSRSGPRGAEALRSGRWPPALREQILRALERVPGSTVAVRSSATCEDGERFSLAGQFESYLSVPRAEVLDRIVDCWASLQGRRARSYMQRMPPGGARMGVVLQEQVVPRWSGVAFSFDPVTRSLDELTVEWTEGTGDALVRGTIVPERLRIARDARETSEALPAGLGEHMLALRDAVLRIEAAYGLLMDVEWCATEDRLHVLQARPVTTANLRTDHLWSSINLCENFPAPLTPLAWSFLRSFYAQYLRALLRLFGWRGPDIEAVSPLVEGAMGIHAGRIHYDLTLWYQLVSYLPWSEQLARALDGYLGQEVPVRPPPPSAAPSLRRRNRTLTGRCRFLLRLARLVLGTGRWLRRLDRRLPSERQAWRHAVSAASGPREAALAAEAPLRLVVDDWDGPAGADVAVGLLTGLLGHLIRSWCRRDPAALLPDLLQGLVVRSDEPSRVLWDLSRRVSAGPDAPKDYTSWLASLDPASRRAFEQLLDRYGARCYSDCNLAEPTFAERPDLAFELVRRYAGLGSAFPEAQRMEALGREQILVQELSHSLGTMRSLAFRLVLRLSRRAIQQREEGRLVQSVLFGEARAAFLKLAVLLEGAGALRRPEDLFELTWEEARDLSRGAFPYPECLPQLMEARRARRVAAADIVLPRLFLLPPGARCPARAATPQPEHPRAGERRLQGLAVSQGQVRGRARVLRDPSHEGLENGEILVAGSTDPGWTPLILMSSGLVLERGGLLSHGAIVAREFGIPGLVQVKDACAEIASGDTLLLDADNGTVVVEARA